MNLKDAFEIIDRIDNLGEDISEEVSDLLNDIYYLLIVDCKNTFDEIMDAYEMESEPVIKEPQKPKQKVEKISPEKPSKTIKSPRAKQNKPSYEDDFNGLL